MPPSDLTPMRDPRNAVGLMTDVLDLVVKTESWQSVLASDDEAVAIMTFAREAGRKFSKSPKTIANSCRRSGSVGFYEKVNAALEPVDHWLIRDARRREHRDTLRDLVRRVLLIVEAVMRDAVIWEKYTKPQKVYQGYGRPNTMADPMWFKEWHDFVSLAQRFGVDMPTIAKIECNWRFRDLTNRSHRGLNTRAAFEAAWLAGQYKFAIQLVTEPFK